MMDGVSVATCKCPIALRTLIGTVALIAALWAYQPSLGGDFFRDDFVWVRRAQDVTTGQLSWSFECARAFRPFANLYFIALWLLFGDNPFPYHLTSFFLHIIGSVMVIWLCYHFSRSYTASILGGVTFALLSSPSSAVMWVSAVFDLICLCLCVPAIITASKYGREGDKIYGLLALTCFGLALGAKEVAIGLLPLIVLVVYLTPGIIPLVRIRRLIGIGGGLVLLSTAYLVWRSYRDIPTEGYGSEPLKALFFVPLGLFKTLLPPELVNWVVKWIGLSPNKETWPIATLAAVGICCLVVMMLSLRWFSQMAAKQGYSYWWLIFAWPVAFLGPPSLVVEGSGITPVSHLLYLPAVGVALGVNMAAVLLCRASVQSAWRWAALVCLIGYLMVNVVTIHSRSLLWQQMGEQTRTARAVILDHAGELREAQEKQRPVIAVDPPRSMKNDVARLVHYWLGFELSVYETTKTTVVDKMAPGKVRLYLHGQHLGRDLD